MLIAVDGPLASGKGTIARHLAQTYNLPYLDTGLLYRATALGVLRAGQDPQDEQAALAQARCVDSSALEDTELRSARVGSAASQVAAFSTVRKALFDYQRAFAAQPGGAVLDGRDIGTVICPQADVKLWVVAPVAERARRRYAELRARGETISYDEMLTQLRERDARDAGREDAPMRRAADAHLLNTGDLSIDAAFEEARRIVDAATAEPSGSTSP